MLGPTTRHRPQSGPEPGLGVGGESRSHPEWSMTGMAMVGEDPGINAQKGGLPRADSKPVGIIEEIGPPDKPVYLAKTTLSSSPSLNQSRAYHTPSFIACRRKKAPVSNQLGYGLHCIACEYQ